MYLTGLLFCSFEDSRIRGEYEIIGLSLTTLSGEHGQVEWSNWTAGEGSGHRHS